MAERRKTSRGQATLFVRENENGENAETFCEGGSNKSERQHFAGSAGITTDSFNGAEANKAYTDGGAENGDTRGEVGDIASDLSEEHGIVFWLFVLSVVHVLIHMLPTGKGLSVGVFVALAVAVPRAVMRMIVAMVCN